MHTIEYKNRAQIRYIVYNITDFKLRSKALDQIDPTIGLQNVAYLHLSMISFHIFSCYL